MIVELVKGRTVLAEMDGVPAIPIPATVKLGKEREPQLLYAYELSRIVQAVFSHLV